MSDILRNIDVDKQKNRASFYALFLSLYVAFFMGMGSTSDVDVSQITSQNPLVLLIVQGITSLFLFIIVGFVFAKVALKLNPGTFFDYVSIKPLLMVILITICGMVVNSAIAEWNMSIDFPDSAFESWAKKSEENLKILTEHLTQFDSLTHFLIAFFVVAIIPAIGEELIFRGLIQNFFVKSFNNPHVGIWVTGLIFSAIHMQFYGLVPRALLGVLFGYIYFWSGKLSLAMIAHLINNGLALLVLYLSQQGTLSIAPDQMDSSAPWPAVIVFGVIGFIVMRSFYLQTQTRSLDSE